MTKIKLLASDLDGTLLPYGTTELGPEVCGLIKQLNEQGIRFAPASGRQLDNLHLLFEPVKDEITYVCQNGAGAVADGKRLCFFPMDEALGREIVAEVKRFPELNVFVSQFDCSYVEEGRDAFFAHVRDVVRLKSKMVPDICSVIPGCSKISIYKEDGTEERLPYWQKKFGNRCAVVSGGPQWIDIMPKGVNKQTAMKVLLEYLGIRPEETMVFGDNLNDFEMLEAAGIGAAVETAVPEILACADVVVSSVEDALKEVLAGKNRIEDWVRK